jgi:hypothetical protein
VPRTTSRPTALPPCLKAQCLLPNSNKLLPKCSMQRLPSGLFLKTQQTESSIHHVGGQKKKKKEADQTEDNLIKLFNNGNGFPTLRSTQNLVRSCSRDYTRQKACTKKN